MNSVRLKLYVYTEQINQSLNKEIFIDGLPMMWSCHFKTFGLAELS